MAQAKKSPPENRQPYGRPWWTARECWTTLGISRQRWQRLAAEQQIESKTDEHGIARFDPDTVEDVGERLGLSASGDSNVTAMTVMRDTIETQSEYVKLLQDNAVKMIGVLLDENTDLRKLRAEEQKAHLQSIVATQEALDHKAEREQQLEHARGVELRQALALEWLTNKIGPKILEQWQNSGHVKKIVALVQGLDDAQVEALKVLVTDEQRAAIEELRKAPTETKEAPANGV